MDARASWVAESCSGTFLSTMLQPPANVLHDESLSVDMLFEPRAYLKAECSDQAAKW